MGPQMLVVMSAAMFAVWAVAMRPLSMMLGSTGAAAAMWVVYGLGGLALWMISPAFAQGSGGAAAAAAGSIGWKGWSMAAAAALPAMAGALLFAMGIEGGVKIGIATGISAGYPALAALLAWAFFGESLGPKEIAGLAMVVAGGWMLAK